MKSVTVLLQLHVHRQSLPDKNLFLEFQILQVIIQNNFKTLLLVFYGSFSAIRFTMQKEHL